MLAADDTVVRMAAQQAVLAAGGASVPRLIEQLAQGKVDANAALAVIANLPDPRFIPLLEEYASSDDDRTRTLIAKALGNGGSSSVPQLLTMLEDADETVRATAIDSLARLDAMASVNAIGACLADRSFMVRRAAGEALDRLGAAGRLVLRRHLEHHDRFAADMARQVLDSASARLGVSLLPASDEVLIDLDEPDAYAAVEVAKPVDLTVYRPDQIRATVHAEANRALGQVSDEAGSGPLTHAEMTNAMFFAITAADVIEALLAPVEPAS
ncbi:MAG: HEAT repeat domain-containing protein [Acidimicrobiales bacterium]